MTNKIVRIVIPFLLLAAMLPAADPQLIGLLMPDAKVVAGINVEQAKNSPFGQYLLTRTPGPDQGFQKLTALTGFDPRRDLQEVLMASRGEPGQHTGLVVARGTFDSARIFGAARLNGQVTTLYNGVEMVSGKNSDDHHAVAFLNGVIAIAGDDVSVRAAIDRRNTPSILDPALAAKISALSATQDAWTVSIVPVSALGQNVPNANLNGMLQGDLLKSIQQASAGVKFGAVVQFSGEAVARSDKDATALVDVVRFLAGMVQTNAPSSADATVASLVQSLDVKADGATVTVGLGVPEAMLEKLVNGRHPRVIARINAQE